jgi:hypothetical protein
MALMEISHSRHESDGILTAETRTQLRNGRNYLH